MSTSHVKHKDHITHEHEHHHASHPAHHEEKHEENPDVSEKMPELYRGDDEHASDIAFDHDVTTFLSWHAPGRPFKEHSKEYFINSFLIMMAVEIILFFFSEYVLMLVVFSFVFFSFALAIVPPKTFYYKVTSEGIRIEDHFFIWQELYDFYFLKHHGQVTLHVRTKPYFPGELTITLGDLSPTLIKNTLLPYLPYREYVKPTFMERAGDWLGKNFPLEKSTT